MKSATAQAALGKIIHTSLMEDGSDPVKVLEEFVQQHRRPVKARIKQDQDPQNPRTDYDNADVMFCKHSRSTMGDKDAQDPMVEETYFVIEGPTAADNKELTEDEAEEVREFMIELSDQLQAEWDGVSAEPDAYFEDVERASAGVEAVGYSKARTRRVLRDDIAICLPIFAYEHSGITISHGAFSCIWDSGQLGWHYITKKALADEWTGDEEKAKEYLKATLKIYDDYLQGNVWFFQIEDEDGAHIDGCGGFFGSELEETGILDHVEEQYKELIKQAWEKRFDRVAWASL